MARLVEQARSTVYATAEWHHRRPMGRVVVGGRGGITNTSLWTRAKRGRSAYLAWSSGVRSDWVCDPAPILPFPPQIGPLSGDAGLSSAVGQMRRGG